jgi:hypothetical protein
MKKFIQYLLMLSMLSTSIWIPNAQATLVSSEQVADSQSAHQDRERLRALIDREDVREQLQSRGVNAAAAQARVDALTDKEVASISGELDSLPAGGDIIGLLLTIIIVLIITDILGLTKVFSFTRSQRR